MTSKSTQTEEPKWPGPLESQCFGPEDSKTFQLWGGTNKGSWWPAHCWTYRRVVRTCAWLSSFSLSLIVKQEEIPQSKRGLLTSPCTCRCLRARLANCTDSRRPSWNARNSIWFSDYFEMKWKSVLSSSTVTMQAQDTWEELKMWCVCGL